MPFHLYFTSCKFPEMKRPLSKFFSKHMENPDSMPEVFTEKSHMELFDPQRLVYLSPDSRNELKYNADDVYVIGGLVDPSIKANASLSKAKRENIRHASFPLKKYLGMHTVLNLEQCLAILHDYRLTRDWFYSFRWVPPRKFKNMLKTSPYTSESENVYFAQLALSPENFWSDLGRMNSTTYRKKYLDIMKSAPKSDKLQDPNKYKISKENRKSSFSFIESM